MRKVLIRIALDDLWKLESATGEWLVGFGFLMLPVLAFGAWASWKAFGDKNSDESPFALLLTAIGIPLAAMVILPSLAGSRLPTSFPIFGYGFMLMVGFMAAMHLTVKRAETVKIDADRISEMAMWILVCGIIGARIFYLVQYHERIFAGKSFEQGVASIFSLWDGGLVFFGGMILGTVGFVVFCRRHKIDMLEMADVTAPSIFVGLGFGRIGCFLYGCCYGGECSLPWAVQFPPGSVPFEVLAHQGLLAPDSTSTMPLHPTQIYSSINAFVLAGILAWFFRRRPWKGAVLALGWVTYPVTRFVLEVIRNDEPGRFNTSLTISQWVSILLFTSGICFLGWMLSTQKKRPASNWSQQPRTA